MRVTSYLLGVGAVLLTASASQASLILNLDNPAQSGFPGNTISFSGTLTNTDSVNVSLDAINFNLNPGSTGAFTIDDSPFFTLTPASLAANGGFYSGELFKVTINPVAPATYGGSVSISTDAAGGPPSQNFSVQINGLSVSAPEPTTGALLLMVGATVGYIRRRRNNK